MKQNQEDEQLNNLSPVERGLIIEYRRKVAQQKNALDFQRKAIATAYAVDLWLDDTGEGLTFSTFINTFGYQEKDGSQMYDAIRRIYDAAWPQ